MRGAVVVVAALVVCGWGNVQMASADTSPSQCKEERNLLVNACRPVIYGRSPSADCCQRVRVSHVECVCPYVTPKTAAIIGVIGVDNVVKKIEGCGRTVPRKFKCGSKLLLYSFYFILFFIFWRPLMMIGFCRYHHSMRKTPYSASYESRFKF